MYSTGQLLHGKKYGGHTVCHMWPTVVGASTSAALPSIQPSIQHWSTRAQRSIDTEETGGVVVVFRYGSSSSRSPGCWVPKRLSTLILLEEIWKWLRETWLYSDSGVWGLWGSAAWSWTQLVVCWLVTRTWFLISVHDLSGKGGIWGGGGWVKLLDSAWFLLGRLGETLSDRTPKVTRQRDTIFQDELWPWRKWASFELLTGVIVQFTDSFAHV